MKLTIALAFAVTASAAMSSVAAQSPSDAQKYDKGAAVTLQGCVVAGEAKDTWVLTNVKEWPAGTTDMGKFGKRYYWLDKLGKDLRAHGGHTIQVVGKIDEVKKSEIEIKQGEDGAGMTVEIEGPGKDVKTTVENAQVNPIGAIVGSGKDIPITLLKVKVEEIKMISSNCQP
ncbi:MAG TPA: hypothetical protein VNT81_10590 [Vicinamibacterales bacterium]|nr:hypothetical protein [Vicinamibacterales bacterium]